MHKIWFYIALLAVLIGGVYASLPSDAERERRRIALEKRKAERKKNNAPQQASGVVAPAASAASATH